MYPNVNLSKFLPFYYFLIRATQIFSLTTTALKVKCPLGGVRRIEIMIFRFLNDVLFHIVGNLGNVFERNFRFEFELNSLETVLNFYL